MNAITTDLFPAFAPVTLHLDGLAAQRAGRALTRPVTARWNGGDAVLLRAPNGVGKSTLLRQIAGISSRAGHRFVCAGVELSPRSVCAWLGHVNGLDPHERVLPVLREHGRALGLDRAEERIRAVVTAFRLAPLLEAETAKLSAGQQRRVALARVAMSERPVWLLDEPAAPLDHAAKGWLDEAVAAHRARGGLVLAAVHADPPWPQAQTLTLVAAP